MRITSASKKLSVGFDELIQTSGTALFGAFNNNLDIWQFDTGFCKCAQCSQVHDNIALAIGGASTVPAAITLGEFPWAGGPGGFVSGWLDVVMRVEQYGFCICGCARQATGQSDGTIDGVMLG